MTIVKLSSHKKELKWKLIFSLLGISLAILIVACGFIYSRAVEIKHAISSAGNTIQEERAKNAELKSMLFALTDPQTIDSVAYKKGLVKDNNPQWVFVSF